MKTKCKVISGHEFLREAFNPKLNLVKGNVRDNIAWLTEAFLRFYLGRNGKIDSPMKTPWNEMFSKGIKRSLSYLETIDNLKGDFEQAFKDFDEYYGNFDFEDYFKSDDEFIEAISEAKLRFVKEALEMFAREFEKNPDLS